MQDTKFMTTNYHDTQLIDTRNQDTVFMNTKNYEKEKKNSYLKYCKKLTNLQLMKKSVKQIEDKFGVNFMAGQKNCFYEISLFAFFANALIENIKIREIFHCYFMEAQSPYIF